MPCVCLEGKAAKNTFQKSPLVSILKATTSTMLRDTGTSSWHRRAKSSSHTVTHGSTAALHQARLNPTGSSGICNTVKQWTCMLGCIVMALMAKIWEVNTNLNLFSTSFS